MRKNMKKFSVAALTAAMSVSMALPAFAGTMQMPSGEKATGHKYDVYQILTGDVSGDNQKTLSNVKWGAHVPGKTAGTDLTAEELANFIAAENEDAKTGDQVLAYVKGLLDTNGDGLIDNAAPAALGDVAVNDLAAGAEVELPDGYYLVADDVATLAELGNQAASYYMLNVSGNKIVYVGVTGTDENGNTIGQPKSDKPTLDKEVSDEVGDGERPTGWGETADHEINEVFQFRLTANIPDTDEIGKYESYYLRFTDTMSKEVTYDGDMVVTVKTKDGTTRTLNSNQYTVYTVDETGKTEGEPEGAGQTFEVEISDLITVFGENESDKIDIRGAEVVVTFNAHLNEDAVVGDGTHTGENINKGKLTYSNNPNHEGEGKPSTSETPDDTVFVFTYDQPATKVDANNKDNKLPNAQFRLERLKPANAETGDEAEWVEVKVSEKTDENGATVYYPEANGTATIKSGDDGSIKVIGLDHDRYRLVETKAPEGYNLMNDPVEFNLTADHTEDQGGASATATLKRVNGDNIQIENRKGSELPETGGMGTTVIYTVGGMLVIGAGAALVSRRRRSAK